MSPGLCVLRSIRTSPESENALLTILQLLGGLSVLLVGGDFLVRGSSRIAKAAGMSQLLIGMTIVSLGTSAPELAVCLDAVLDGTPEIALGNIVGSNISNILLILGLTAMVYPITVSRRVVRVEVPVMIGFSILFLVLAFDGRLSVADGVGLVFCMVMFIAAQIRGELRRTDASLEDDDNGPPEADTKPRASIPKSLGLMLAGILMLWTGAGWMVDAAVVIAKTLGVSELVIGLTIVAIGSSAPELVTTISAVKQGHAEMALGNVLGSNIANLLTVGGLSALCGGGIRVPGVLFELDLPVMLLAAIICLPVLGLGNRVSRAEGAVFFTLFCGFTIALFTRA